MIIPDYWAEARIQGKLDAVEQGARGRAATVRRFGWSDESQAAAQAHAQERAQQAWDALLAGEGPKRREPKMNYGVPGIPIREEVIERHGAGTAEAVVTRNSYGALCLNSPAVLFADLDFDFPATTHVSSTPHLCITLALAALAGAGLQSWPAAIAVLVIAGFAAARIVRLQRKRKQEAQEPLLEAAARARVEAFIAARPGWHARLYRTPAGLRLLALHRTFDPHEPEVAECFTALASDPVYARLCQQQHCFRARVSAKPWRIGIGRITPSPGVWPVDPRRMADRLRWIESYEQAAQGHAACSFIATLGSGTVDPTAQAVQELHDRLCRAEENLPIA